MTGGKKMVFKLQQAPSAGFVPNIDKKADPGGLSRREQELLRALAERVARVAEKPEQESKRQLWYRHNDLQKTRPLLLVFPEDAWFEMLPTDRLQIKDPYWRQWEWYLRHLLYRDEHLDDDFVIESQLWVPAVVVETGWGVEAQYEKRGDQGSYVWEAPLKEEKDIDRLRHPTIEVDVEATQARYERVGQVFADLIPVGIHWGRRIDANLIGTVTTLRGLQQVFVDMYDRPQWLHQLFDFVTQGFMKMLDYLEENGYLSLNNRNHYIGSGSIGYTSELPANGYDGRVRLQDLWVHGMAQELSEVSPEHHEAFVLDYQLKIMNRFGLVDYGCCEPYTRKFDMLEKIPNLRRVSVSPWCDIDIAAEKLASKYIFSWKPNPALLVGQFNEEVIRASIRRTLDATQDCFLEIILKDTFTVENKPERLERWIAIAREEIENSG